MVGAIVKPTENPHKAEALALGTFGLALKYGTAQKAAAHFGVSYSTLYLWLNPRQRASRRGGHRNHPRYTLTPQRLRVLELFHRSRTPPTVREICDKMGWSGTNTAADALTALVSLGYLECLGEAKGRSGPARSYVLARRWTREPPPVPGLYPVHLPITARNRSSLSCDPRKGYIVLVQVGSNYKPEPQALHWSVPVDVPPWPQ